MLPEIQRVRRNPRWPICWLHCNRVSRTRSLLTRTMMGDYSVRSQDLSRRKARPMVRHGTRRRTGLQVSSKHHPSLNKLILMGKWPGSPVSDKVRLWFVTKTANFASG